MLFMAKYLLEADEKELPLLAREARASNPPYAALGTC